MGGAVPSSNPWAGRLAAMAIALYRLVKGAGMLNYGICRFWPTCSEYAESAFSRHGIAKGLVLSARRILRCHPGHPGGLDPVPERRR